MTSISNRLKVGTAACAMAVAGSLGTVAPAHATPAAPAPASPVVLSSTDAPLHWWGSPRPSGSHDLLRWFKPVTSTPKATNHHLRFFAAIHSFFRFGCYGHKSL